jgi:chlorophyllide a reductase subunit X
VLLIGCDPKSDTTTLLFGGKACPTIIETSTQEEGSPARKSKIGDVCFKRDGVFAMELGGPEVGRGCGGRGIIHGFELLEKLGFHDWDFDYVLLDFLGDVVCGGFGLPIARDMCQKVIVVGSNDLQSLYVANNVCSAVEYFRKLGGNVGVAGMVINKDDGTGEAQAFAKAVGIPVLASIPQMTTSAQERELPDRRHARGQWGAAVRRAGRERRRSAADAAPPLTRTGCWLFDGSRPARASTLEPATDGRHVRQVATPKALPRSRLRRGLRSARWMTRRSQSRRCRRRRRTSAEVRVRGEARPAKPPEPARRRPPRVATAWAAMPAPRDGKGRPQGRQVRDAGPVRQGLSRKGPHDKPQSMCPAFGSLARGLRMRRTATVLSRLGLLRLRPDLHLAFLRRPPLGRLRAVQFRDPGHRQAVRGHPRRRARDGRSGAYDAIVVTNLCVPTASGVPLRLLPEEINGVRIVGIDVPGFGVPTHAEAKDVLAGAMLNYARTGGRAGPVQAPARVNQTVRPSRCWARCSRPIRWESAGMLAPLGLAAGPVVPTREWRELYAALDCAAVAAIHPFYTARSASSRPPAAPSSAPRRWATTAPPPGSTPSATPATCRRRQGRAAQNALSARHQGRAGRQADQGHASRCRAMKARSFWSRGC